MKKMRGQICDSCRKLFYPGDLIHEFCNVCANTVYCVMNVYEDGSKELFSIHRTMDSAVDIVKKGMDQLDKLNHGQPNKIKQVVESWLIKN